MAAEWSPWFAWWMDLGKGTVSFAITALATVYIINRGQDARAKAKTRSDALFQLNMAAISEFRIAAIDYETMAISAYTDLYQMKTKDKSPSMQTYEGAAYKGLEAALVGMEIRFYGVTEVTDNVAKLRQIHNDRHKVYNGLIDAQLDKGPLPDMWQRAQSGRKQFDDLLDKAKIVRN